ncbi:MAG: VirB3 family type IV secretion system protein [Bradyrhizobium sp.]
MRETLFLALTRPSSIKGIPYEIALIGGCTILLFAIVMGNIFYLLLIAPAFYGAQWLCRKDLRFGRLFFGWVNTSGWTVNARIWGGASPAPLPLRRKRYGAIRG